MRRGDETGYLILVVAAFLLGRYINADADNTDDLWLDDDRYDLVYCRANDEYYHDDDACCADWSDSIEAIPTTREYATEVLHRQEHKCYLEEKMGDVNKWLFETMKSRDSIAAVDPTAKPIWWPAKVEVTDYSHVNELGL